MDRNEARKAAEVMLAYADGKEIEFLTDNGDWRDNTNPCFNWDDDDNSYRIKITPTYRPFDSAEECWEEMKKHEPFGWVTFEGSKEYIVRLTDETIKLYTTSYYDYEQALSKFKFVDGSFFGKLTEEG